MYSHVVASDGGRLGGGAVGQGIAQVFFFQYLPEFLYAPLGDQELEAGRCGCLVGSSGEDFCHGF